MQYVPLAPGPPLDRFVETLFYLGAYDPEQSIERLVPDGACSLVIELDGQERWIADNDTLAPIQYCREAWLSGPHTNFLSISALRNTELMAVRFRPGGLCPWLHNELSSLTNRVVPASEIFNGAVSTLRQTLIDAPSVEQKLQTLLQWLEQRMSSVDAMPDVLNGVVGSIQANPTVATISEVIENSGFTRKHLVTLFRRHIGLRPKEFQRILRFNRALAEIQNEQPISWTSISTDCGYSDQAHFIRDFRHFSGMNSTQFLTLETDRVNFFPIDSDENSSS